jgi:hypothetical protein
MPLDELDGLDAPARARSRVPPFPAGGPDSRQPIRRSSAAHAPLIHAIAGAIDRVPAAGRGFLAVLRFLPEQIKKHRNISIARDPIALPDDLTHIRRPMHGRAARMDHGVGLAR